MLRRPHPWLLRRVPALIRDSRLWRSRLLRATARVRLGGVTAPAERLADVFARAAMVRGVRTFVLEALAAACLEDHGAPAVEAAAEAALGRLPPPRAARLYRAVVLALASRSLPRALAFGDRCLPADSPASARTLARCHLRAGAIERPLALLGADRRSARRHASLRKQAMLLTGGVALGQPAPRPWTPRPERVLYYVNQCLPHHSSGYAIRTHWLLRALRREGWDISAYARFGYPNDRYDFIGVRTVARQAAIDGVRYAFTPHRKGFGQLDIERYHAVATATLLDQAAVDRPAVIHAASNYMTGLAGADVARRLGIPFVYEVRGLWHMTRASRQPEYADSDHYRLIERLEAQAAMAADHVFVITRAVGDVLTAHGVPAGKISVLPNAVNTSAFTVRDRDRDLARAWGVDDVPVIGYIGSFKHYEGLDYLLEAAARLRARLGDVFRVLLVGDGEAHDDLLAQARRLKLTDVVTFTGRQPPATIPAFYSMVDIMAFSRKGVRVCEVVSPLKPLEAMATGTAIVASDVAALAEIVDHERTGLLHVKDDVDSLCDQLARLITQPALRDQLAAAGHAWVHEHRTWSRIAALVTDVYRDLLSGRRGKIHSVDRT